VSAQSSNPSAAKNKKNYSSSGKESSSGTCRENFAYHLKDFLLTS
jgi:hypothetical protein